MPIVRCKGYCFFLLRKETAKEEGWHWQPHHEGLGDQLAFQLSLSLPMGTTVFWVHATWLSCLRTRLDLEVAVPCTRDQVLQLKKGLLKQLNQVAWTQKTVVPMGRERES